jgi:hypothetical protein
MEVDETSRLNMYPNRARQGPLLTVPQLQLPSPMGPMANSQSVDHGAADVHPDRVGLVQGADRSDDGFQGRQPSKLVQTDLTCVQARQRIAHLRKVALP